MFHAGLNSVVREDFVERVWNGKLKETRLHDNGKM